jgi:DNA-binding CsgD family transcriptional regulator
MQMDNDLPPTQRQLQILKLAAAGYNLHQIAQTLEISRHTVANHHRKLYARLRVFTLSSALIMAYRRGLVDLDDIEPIRVPNLHP